MCVCITTELRRERRETSEREYTNERKAFSVTHFTSNLSNHLPLLSPQDPLSFPLLRAERLTFIVNSTPNVRTWHFEYLELNCKHRSTRRLKPSHADGVNDPTIYWIVAYARRHAVYVYVCVCAAISLLVSLSSAVTSSVISSVCLFIFWISLRDPIFESFHWDISQWMIHYGRTVLFSFMTCMGWMAGNLTLSCVRRFCWKEFTIKYIELSLFQTKRFQSFNPWFL